VRVETNSLGTSVADKASYLSRFLYKLLEIMGAAVATAVSGYLVAHLGGFLPPRTQAPTPPAVAVAPSERAVPKTVPANAPASQPAAPQTTQSAAAPETGEQRTTQPQPDTTGSAAQGARKTANANIKTTPAPATTPAPTQATASARKRGKSDKSETAVTDASRPRDATDLKPRDGEDEASVEARVRAALANVDANRPAPADMPPRRGDSQGAAGQARPAESSPGTTAAAIPARPVEQPTASAGGAGQPRSADLGSPVQQPVILPTATQPPAAQPAAPGPLQVVPTQPPPAQQADPLTTVEIKSRPVANIEAMPAAEPPPQEERGVLSAIKHILPDFRRPASADEVPRPPAPVGE
jgi:hypothetical protein